MTKPIISIIMPVYNAENFLRKSIESVISQTFSDLELIMVDDGSTDKSPEICDEYAKKDSRIKVVHQKNAGVSQARNTAIEIAAGDWLGFVDSDDWCEHEMFETLYKNATENDTDMSVCNLFYVENNIKREKKINGATGNLDTETAIKMLCSEEGFEGYISKMIKRDILCDNNLLFPTDVRQCEDFIFFYNVIKCCDKIYFDETPLYNYFMNDTSATHLHLSMKNADEYIYKKMDSVIGVEKLIEKEKNKKYKSLLKAHVAMQCICLLSRVDEKQRSSSECNKLKSIFKKYFFQFICSNNVHVGRKKSYIAVMHPKLYRIIKINKN